MFQLCAPAIIYLVFSLTQIIFDTFKGLYNTALLKSFLMILVTILLNALCSSGMGIISWIIVFIPFIFMTVIITILLYIFGLDPETGKINVNKQTNIDRKINKDGNLIFLSKETNKNKNIKNKQMQYMDVSYSDTPLDNIHNENI